MRIFNIDQHISVIADLKMIFSRLGHQIADVCLSGHAPIMGRKKDSVPMLDGDKWCGMIQREIWNDFHKEYHDELDEYDAFLVTYPPLFSLLYKNFPKKPIIIQIPIRYEYPCQSSPEDWEFFNDYLKTGIDEGRIFLAANNEYDQKYSESFLQRPVELIPSLCAYTGWKYDAQYAIQNKNALYCAAQRHSALQNASFVWKHDALQFGHPWSAIGRYRAVVHFPYNVSIMSMFEHYYAGIPMYVPTPGFLAHLYLKGKGARVMEQYTWAGTFGRDEGSTIKGSWHIAGLPDPNAYRTLDSALHWWKHADFYSGVLKHVQQFNSYEELIETINSSTVESLATVSYRMQEHNVERTKSVYATWNSFLSRVDKARAQL